MNWRFLLPVVVGALFVLLSAPSLPCHAINLVRTTVASSTTLQHEMGVKRIGPTGTPVDASKIKEDEPTPPADSPWVIDEKGDKITYESMTPYSAASLPTSYAALRDPKSNLYTRLMAVTGMAGWKYGIAADGKVSMKIFYEGSPISSLPSTIPEASGWTVTYAAAKSYQTMATLNVGGSWSLRLEKVGGGNWQMETSTIGACLRRRRARVWDVNDHVLTTFHGVGPDAKRKVYTTDDYAGKVVDFKYHEDPSDPEEGDWALVKLGFWYTCGARGAKNGAKKWNTVDDFSEYVRAKAKAKAKPKINYQGMHNTNSVELNPDNLLTTLRLRGYAVAGYLNFESGLHQKGDSGSGCYYTDDTDATPYLVGILKGGSQDDGQCTPIWMIQPFLPDYLEVV